MTVLQSCLVFRDADYNLPEDLFLREVFHSKSKMMKSILSIELLYIENLLLNFRCSALAYRAVYFQVSLGQECQRIE